MRISIRSDKMGGALDLGKIVSEQGQLQVSSRTTVQTPNKCIGCPTIASGSRESDLKTASLHESINEDLKAIGACRAIRE